MKTIDLREMFQYEKNVINCTCPLADPCRKCRMEIAKMQANQVVFSGGRTSSQKA